MEGSVGGGGGGGEVLDVGFGRERKKSQISWILETKFIQHTKNSNCPGLEINTRPLVFTSSLSVRTSENCYWLALSDE